MTERLYKLSHRYAALAVGLFSVLMLLMLVVTASLVNQRTNLLRAQLTDSFTDSHTEFVVEALKSDSLYLSNRLFNPLYKFDISTLNEEVKRIDDWLSPRQVLILDSQGSIVTDGDESNRNYGERLDISSYAGSQHLQIQNVPGGRRLIFPISVNDWLAGYAIIDLSNHQGRLMIERLNADIDQQLDEFNRYFIYSALGALLAITFLGVLIAWRLTHTLSDPLQEMIKAAERFADGDLDYRLPRDVLYQGEIARLSGALHSMASQLHEAEQKILVQAHYDTLTGLPNRFLSLDRLSQMLRDAERHSDKVALLFLDLDDFKKVNDSLGHDEGDHLLKQAGRRLKGAIRESDTVGRLGGDEFLIVLGGVHEVDDVQGVIDNLLVQFRQPFYTLQDQQLVVTLSIGAAIFPDDNLTESGLLRNADLAMYHAKSSGRNTFSYFTEHMNRLVSRRLQLENELRHAVSEQQLYVVYQPKYDLISETIVGVEALLRWCSPTLGEVSPDEFIPLAEHTGQIHEIGQFVMAHALTQLQIWRGYKADFTMAVNLSPRQFDQGDLVAYLQEQLQQRQLAAQGIDLEITEGVLIRSQENCQQLLEQLQSLGFSIALDDFGTGYSSLSYLRSYPFNVVKIDRSFVRDICDDEDDRALISAMIAMAEALNLTIVAEGVETQAQLSALQALGCHLGQGYYFNKPLLAQQINELLMAQGCTAPKQDVLG